MLQKIAMVFIPLNKVSALTLLAITFIAPIQPILYGVLFLIFADTITGIMASFKRVKLPFKILKWNSWKHITSARLGDTITKALIYMLLIICGFVIDKHIINNSDLYFTKFFAASVSLREVKSLIENAAIILNNNFMSVFKSVVTKGWKQTLSDMFKDDNTTDNK